MAWKVEWSKGAERDLENLSSEVEKRVIDFIENRIVSLENPRDIGEALRGGKLGDLWKYRGGDYRVMASIEDDIVKILVVAVGHRREVYR